MYSKAFQCDSGNPGITNWPSFFSRLFSCFTRSTCSENWRSCISGKNKKKQGDLEIDSNNNNKDNGSHFRTPQVLKKTQWKIISMSPFFTRSFLPFPFLKLFHLSNALIYIYNLLLFPSSCCWKNLPFFQSCLQLLSRKYAIKWRALKKPKSRRLFIRQ